MTNVVVRLAAVLAIGVGASACSSVPDWVDPTTWADNGQNGQAPDLADIPGRPQSSTPDDQKRVADSLTADRKDANYSADQLTAEVETSAPPPPPPAAEPDQSQTASNVTVGDSPASTSPSSSNESQTAGTPPPAAVPTRVATAEPPPSLPQPSASSSGAGGPTPQQNQGSADESLGFRPSMAPPLDASVAQFVPSSVLDRYRQTASLGPGAEAAHDGAPAAPKHGRHRHAAEAGAGGSQQTDADVVADMDTVQDAPGASLSAYADANGNPPIAVIFFPWNGTTLNASSRSKVKEAVNEYRARGSQGFIKVIGHSSSRTPNMPIEKHLELIFRASQDRANAVAREIIREGIPPDKVLVDAVGDSQPVYYESMPKGEEGNRRAEIFLQS